MDRLESVLKEERVFYPSEEFRKQAHIKSEEEYQRLYEESVRDPEGFWGRVASELHWFEPWRKVLEGDLPHPKWFVGGKTNLSYNALDRHVKTWRRNKAAIVWEGEPGEERVLTYHDLWREVQRFANVLKRLGVKKGDRVTIYLPMIPEAAIAMLACTRIGAVHSVVFGGFSAGALADRIKDAEANAEADKERRELVETKNQGESLLHSTQKSLKEHSDKVDPSTVEVIELAMSALEDTLKTEDAGKIKGGIQNLTDAAMKLGEAIYKAQADQADGGDEGGPRDVDDDIVDADFEDLGDNKRK